MLTNLITALFFAIPLGVMVLFAVSLCRFLIGKQQNKRAPGSVPDSALRSRKTLLAISSAMLGVLVAVVISFIVLIFLAVAYM